MSTPAIVEVRVDVALVTFDWSYPYMDNRLETHTITSLGQIYTIVTAINGDFVFDAGCQDCPPVDVWG